MSKYILSSARLSFVVDTDPFRLNAVIHLLKPEACGEISSEIFWIECGDRRYGASEFELSSVEEHDDGVQKLLKLNMKHICGVWASVSFLANKDDTIELIIQLYNADGKDARFVGLGFPFLSNENTLGLQDGHFRAPSKPFESSRGEALLDLHPICRKAMSFVRSDGYGFDVTFDIPRGSNTQECTPELPYINSLAELVNYRTTVRLSRFPAVAVQMKFDAVTEGWKETFCKLKAAARSKVDLDSYLRPDLKWYDESLLHHFAYVYSREVYDYEQNRVDIERLLKAGEEFGGYDVLCLWHQYPRLGVDERSQWDFFEDFPGGLKGIWEIAQQCHQKDVKLMLPYKPWDAPDDMSPDDTARRLADVIQKTDADGFFLDTMFNIPKAFRSQADSVKKGCVFCTELQPENEKALEVLTGSWQQSAPLPYQTPVLRYVFPEHHSHFISRWSIDADRDAMLKKAIMNGSGLVIWQDIFGTWLPYEPYQKAEVSKWKEIWRANKSFFLSPNVFPLWAAEERDLVINAFFDKNSDDAIFTLYNNSDCNMEGKLFSYRRGVGKVIRDLWNDDTHVSLRGNDVYASLKPRRIAIFKIAKD